MTPGPVSIYTLLVPAVAAVLKAAGPFSPGLRKFFAARRGVFPELEEKSRNVAEGRPRLWVHAASVGEFEQARPLITLLKESVPGLAVFVSFLSDSGYEARKDYPDADAVFYLPLDTPANARKTAELVRPDLFMLMRYDFWPSHLLALKRRGAGMILAAAVLQEGSSYFNPVLKAFYRPLFQLFDHIFTVAEKDARAFRDVFGCRAAERAGEPRIDQVIQRSRNSERVGHIAAFFKQRPVLVAGSVWEKDEEVLLGAWLELASRPSLVLVPHKVGPENILRIGRELERLQIGWRRVRQLDASFDASREVLVIDETGYLVELYSVASMAYVGGGFGVNVHNTLEPAVYGIPVIFGPRHHNSPEAEGLLEAGGAYTIRNSEELGAVLRRLVDGSREAEKAGKAAYGFIHSQAGAASRIADAARKILTQGRPRRPASKNNS
ncbi:3-deoxy-D-manno-octulosonic acid transferase [Pelodictyon luteolum]|nr:glycosyltransferase N-terminal domain-containing protein [Pelodictyon luteolum]